MFHPSAKIREKWPNDDKHRLEGVLITGEGTFRVNQKMQQCYCMRINDFDNGSVFYIIKGKLQIDQAAAVPFVAARAPANVPGEAVNPDSVAQMNV